jgi:hypothetical protein
MSNHHATPRTSERFGRLNATDAPETKGHAGPCFRLTRVPQQQENIQTGAGIGCAPMALRTLEFLFGVRKG